MERQNNQLATKQPAKKKIGFFSSMMIVMGSSIGAGIFFKSEEVLNNSRGNLILAIFCWIMASIAVISMAIALVEIAGNKKDNLSLVSWNRLFNSRWIAQASKNFMAYITLPLTFFYMPIYVVMTLQDGIGAIANKNASAFNFGTSYDWVIWLAITTLMGLYFLTIPSLFSKIGNIHNVIVLSVKFIPLIFIMIIGIVLAISGKGGADNIKITSFEKFDDIKIGAGLIRYNHLGGFIGIFISIGSIFFAYDGFYIAAGMQTEMKKPEKTSWALSLGLIIITIFYILIAISMSINGRSFSSMLQYIQSLLGQKVSRIIFGLINIAIAIGVMGVINGFSMWMPRYIESLLAEGELPFWEKFISKLNPNRPTVGVIYSVIIGLGSNIIFTIIGATLYISTNNDYLKYTDGMARLYSFTDLIANWVTVFTFVFIAFAILGVIKNRKNQKIKIKQKVKFFSLFAYITVFFVSLSMLALILIPIIDLFMTIGFDHNSYMHWKNATYSQAHQFFIGLVVGRTMLVVMLIIFHVIVFASDPIQNCFHKQKYGSIEKFHQHRNLILQKYPSPYTQT